MTSTHLFASVIPTRTGPSAPLVARPRPFPSTCENCPWQGDLDVVNGPDWVHFKDAMGNYTHSEEVGYLPVRCKPCAAQARKRARCRTAIESLLPLRERMRERYPSAGWDLFFVTVTRPVCLVEGDLDQARASSVRRFRRWLKHRRQLAVSDGLVAGGTDVIEQVVRVREDGVRTIHTHSHGVWVMPTHARDQLNPVMRLILGAETRDRVVRLEWDKESDRPLHKAASYLTKYLTKEGCGNRSTWGYAVKGRLDQEERQHGTLRYPMWLHVAHARL